MKKILIAVTTFLLLTSCSSTKPAEKEGISLEKPEEVEIPQEVVKQDTHKDFISKLQEFTSEISSRNVNSASENENTVISPLSAYMMFGMLATSSSGQTRDALISLLGMDLYDIYQTNQYYNQSRKEYFDSKIIEKEDKYIRPIEGLQIISNSLWLQNELKPNSNCLNDLMDSFCADVRKVDFNSENREANNRIQTYLSENLNGVNLNIPDFDTNTLAVLINTLFLQDVWRKELKLSDKLYSFSSNGVEKKINMLMGNYERGDVNECDTFRSFYITTKNNYRVTFMVPKEGRSVEDIFTKENILRANKQDYEIFDSNSKVIYTRCIFPEFKVNNTLDLLGLFSDYFDTLDSMEFSSLLESKAQINQMKQLVSLDINKKGILGASATFAQVSGCPIPQDCKDFVVDRDFGFIITDCNNIQLFSGAIHIV